MAYLNKVLLIGNTGKDPDFAVTSTGRKRATFPLATTRRYRDANGEQKEQTDWHTIVAWGKTADIIESLGVHKGMPLFIEGTLTYRSWNDQNGQKRYATDVVIETFQLLGSRQFNQQTEQTYAQPPMAEQPSFQTAAQPQFQMSPMAGQPVFPTGGEPVFPTGGEPPYVVSTPSFQPQEPPQGQTPPPPDDDLPF